MKKPVLFFYYSLIGFLFAFGTRLSAAEKFTLTETAGNNVVFSINTKIEIEGELQTPQEKKLLAHPLKVDANLDYTEKRLPPAGRDARAFRSARVYETARSEISVSENKVTARLRPERSEILMYGSRQGLKPVSPNGLLTRNEINLLQTPGDSLAMLSLLPPEAVEVGEEWSVPSFGMQMLTGTEAVISTEMICKLEKVDNNIATVSFQGELKGATGGAETSATLTGQYEYELEVGYLKRYDLTQKGKADSGPVHPGMDVTVKVHTERYPAIKPELITEEFLADTPLTPPEELMELEFTTPWKLSFRHSRNWHLFQQTEGLVILRLVSNGNFIAQCNMQPLSAALPGKHVSENQFQEDIRISLGDQLQELAPLEKPESKHGLTLFRVQADGTARDLKMNWLYYLCAAPSGKQTSFVFSVESKLLPQLLPEEKQLIQNLRIAE